MKAGTRAALTPTEERIVRLVIAERSNAEAADELGISLHTVEWHLWRAYRKLGVRTREELRGRPLGPATGEPLGTADPKDERSGPLCATRAAAIHASRPRSPRKDGPRT
jgi:DNA-binding CsgD family transcriptional regulator